MTGASFILVIKILSLLRTLLIDDKDFTDDEDIIDDEVSITDDEEAPAVVNEAIRKAGPVTFKPQLPSIPTL